MTGLCPSQRPLAGWIGQGNTQRRSARSKWRTCAGGIGLSTQALGYRRSQSEIGYCRLANPQAWEAASAAVTRDSPSAGRIWLRYRKAAS